MDSILFWDPEKVLEYQQQHLFKTLNYTAQQAPFYKKRFQKEKIAVEKITTLNDFKSIPFTTKEDIQTYNHEFFCVSREQIIDYVTTSGTAGHPITIGLTEKDLERLAHNECTSFKLTGGSNKEVYQLMTTLDKRFMAGMAYFLGARKLGAGIIRVGNGLPQLQWDTIMRVKPSAIICVPSFILKLIEYAEQHHIEYKTSSVKKAICVGEPIRNEDFSLNRLGKKITEKWNIPLFSTYASSEMSAAFTECTHGVGGHLQPDLLFTELIDEQGNPTKKGEAGELVITTIGVEGMPLLRFKTGDICKWHEEPCLCGRTSPRISPILGRKNQMIKYKGTTLYPPALYDILDAIDEIQNYQIEVFTNEIGTDELCVHIGCDTPTETVEKEIKDMLRAKLRVAPTLIFMASAALQQKITKEENRKPIIFIDKR
ncbi:MAG: AMP-binding protein [Bacteroidetes bacterium]|nr:AMP-binding protein [Bacteroidota bacterium]